MAPRCCSPAARVVTVASLLGHVGRITLDDPNFARRRYNPASAYAQSKLANLLFARELHRRLAGTSVSSVAAHPGYSTTGLVSTMARAYPRPVRLLAVPGARVADLFGQAVRTGVLPQLYASGHPGRVRWPQPGAGHTVQRPVVGADRRLDGDHPRSRVVEFPCPTGVGWSA